MIGWLLETLFGVTLLMLLVLAVRRPVALYCGAGWAYALWLLPALRLVLPPLPSLLPIPSTAAFIPAMDGVTASLPMESGPGQWVPFMLATWAGGAVTFLIWHWLAYRSFLAGVTARSRPGDPPSYGGIITLASEAVDGPIALGLLQRRIILPWNFARRFSPGERRLALEHELVHHRRGDILWNLAGLVILAVNWFNPVAWYAFHAFRSDQELACDAAVAKRASAGERHDYACAMVKAASRPGLIAACPLNPADKLKLRLRMIAAHRAGRARMAGGFTAFAGLLAGGLAVSAPGQSGPSQPAAVALAAFDSGRAVHFRAESDGPPIRSLAPGGPVPPRGAVARPAAPVALASAASTVAPSAPTPPAVPLAEPAPHPARLQFHFASADMAAAAPVAIGHAHVGTAQAEMIRVAEARLPATIVHQIRLRQAGGARIVAFRVEGRVIRAGGAAPVPLTEVEAAIERAVAESAGEAESAGSEAKVKLRRARLIAALDRNRFGMVSNVN